MTSEADPDLAAIEQGQAGCYIAKKREVRSRLFRSGAIYGVGLSIRLLYVTIFRNQFEYRQGAFPHLKQVRNSKPLVACE
jgi:hypothetical protein